MRLPKRAVWLWPYSSTTYTQKIERRGRRGILAYAKISASAFVLLFGAAAFSSYFMGGSSTPKASAAAVVVPQVIKQIDSNVPAAVAPQEEIAQTKQLQKLLTDWAAVNSNANWGIALQQLDHSQAYATYQPSEQFYPASIYKLLILPSLFEKLPFTSWGQPMGPGTAKVSYAACIDRMIRLSDNTCGVALGNYTGWKKANDRLKSMGLSGTSLNGYDQQLKTTAGDVNTDLKYLYQSNSYPEAKQAVLDSMSHQIYRNGIPAGSPGCKVYDKIGDLNGYRHDAAIVECPDTSYVLTVLSKGGSYSQIADLAGQVYNYFLP